IEPCLILIIVRHIVLIYPGVDNIKQGLKPTLNHPFSTRNRLSIGVETKIFYEKIIAINPLFALL
ncbi:hypothetical protein QN344_00580, partial [Mucilaginibacter sp. 5B2]|nr:hypothetical protein [Mucilaginibacter sp. 5B2]